MTRPGYFAGEEAPRHPEVILATNPAYRKRNLDLFATAGKMLGVPGFAAGGIAGEVQGFMAAAGFNNVAIAGMLGNASQESNMNPNTPGGGLWQQISNFGMGTGGTLAHQMQTMLPQIEGLKAAMNAAGSPAEAASIFMSGFEKPNAALENLPNREAQANAFYQQLTGAGGGGGGGILSSLLGAAASVANALNPLNLINDLPGPPTLPKWISGLPGDLLGKAASFVKDKIGGLLGGGGGAAPTGGGFSPSQLGTYDGLQVAKWIIPELAWARSKGWGGSVTSGWRSPTQVVSGVFATAPQGQSEHRLDVYPGGAVDVSDYQQFAQIIAGYPGAQKLIQLGIDPLHFSGTGHRTGGIYAGAFGNGGVVSASSPTLALFGEHGPETAAFIPGYAQGTIMGAAMAGHPSWFPNVGAGAPAAAPPGLIQAVTGEPGLPNIPGGIATTASSAAGIAATISGTRAHISTLENQFSTLDQYYNIYDPSSFLNDDGSLNQPAINARLGELGQLIQLRQQIFQAWGKVIVLTQRLIASYREIIRRFKNALASITTKGLKGNALTSAQKHQTDVKTAISQTQGKLSSAIGDLTSAGTDRDSAWISLLSEQNERASVAGTQAQPTVAAAPDLTGTTGTTASAGTTDTTSLLQTIATTAQQAFAVSQAQYAALQSTPPFGGSFAQGGIVPGPPGAPRVIVAHGGETVGAAPTVHIHFANGMDWLREFVSVEVQNGTRGQSVSATRLAGLPGSRGGF